MRFHSKMQLIVGLASKIAQASGAHEVPAVRELCGGGIFQRWSRT